MDKEGMSVAPGEEARACEVLLTNKRLIDSKVLVFLAVPAGSGRRTRRGYELPEIAPPKALHMPATAPAR
jgi:hypothetical protein